MENFECPICGYEGKPARKDTYHYCPDCTVIFVDPKCFSTSTTVEVTDDVYHDVDDDVKDVDELSFS